MIPLTELEDLRAKVYEFCIKDPNLKIRELASVILILVDDGIEKTKELNIKSTMTDKLVVLLEQELERVRRERDNLTTTLHLLQETKYEK